MTAIDLISVISGFVVRLWMTDQTIAAAAATAKIAAAATPRRFR
jgi:hypothetical protein